MGTLRKGRRDDLLQNHFIYQALNAGSSTIYKERTRTRRPARVPPPTLGRVGSSPLTIRVGETALDYENRPCPYLRPEAA